MTPGPLESVTCENSARDVHPGHTPAAESLCTRPHGARHGRAGPVTAEPAAAGQLQQPGGEHAQKQGAPLLQLRRAGEVVHERLKQDQPAEGAADLRVAEQQKE